MEQLKNVKLAANILNSDDLADISDKFNQTMDLSSDQSISGKKNFIKGMNIGDEIFDVGNNSFTVGNNLSTGSYNFFYKGIDLDTSLSTAKIYLTSKQPRYPYPFLIKNGDKTKVLITKNILDLNDITTLSALSAGSNCKEAWNCTVERPWRDDYNQLSIDLGKDYRSRPIEILAKINEYVNDAFSKEESIDQYLNGTSLSGQQVTMVNGDKIQYLRYGYMDGEYDNAGGNVNIQITKNDALTALNSNGIKFADFDYDDASFVFIDCPSLSGPANTSTYSSLNVGVDNYVARRCSMAVGKENVAEADFSFALGRKAKAKDYGSFVWAPTSEAVSQGSSTFTIGIGGNPEDYRNNKVFLYGGGKGVPLYKAIIKHLISDIDNTLLKELKAALDKLK